MQSKKHLFYKVKVLYLFNQVKRFIEVRNVIFTSYLAKWAVEEEEVEHSRYFKCPKKKHVWTDDNVEHRVGTIKQS